MAAGITDRYYALLDWLGEHGIPIDRVAYSIEAKGIPSILVFAVILLLGAWGIWIYTHPQYVITVYNYDGSPYANSTIFVDGKQYTTDSTGKVTLSFRPKSVEVPEDGLLTQYDKKKLEIFLKPIVKKITVEITDGERPVSATIQVTGDMSTKQFSGSEATFSISKVPYDDAIQALSDGTVRIDVIAEGYEPASKIINWKTIKSGDIIHIKLKKKQPPMGNIYITTDPPILGYAYLYKKGVFTGKKAIIKNGNAEIDNVIYGTYEIRVTVVKNGKEYVDDRGRNSKNIIVNEKYVSIKMKVYVPKTILKSTIEVTGEDGSPIEGAEIFLNGDVIAKTDEDGTATLQIEEGKYMNVTVEANGYVPSQIKVYAGKTAKIRLKKIVLAGNLRVKVVDTLGTPVPDVAVKITEGNATFTKNTDENGIAFFEKIPVGTWNITAVADGGKFTGGLSGAKVENGKTTSVSVTLAQTVDVPVNVLVDTGSAKIGAVARVVALNIEGNVVWSGETDIKGHVTAKLPKYDDVVLVATVNTRKGQIRAYTRPIRVSEGTRATIILQETGTNGIEMEGLETRNGTPVISIEKGISEVIARISCTGSCEFNLQGRGINVEGVPPYPAYPLKSELRNGGKNASTTQTNITVSCPASTCIMEVPIYIDTNYSGKIKCADIISANKKYSIPIGMKIPLCKSPNGICMALVGKRVLKVGEFSPVAVGIGSKSKEIFSTKLLGTNAKIVNEDVSGCKGISGGAYSIYAEIGPEKRDAKIIAEIATAETEVKEALPFKIIDGNVVPISLKISPPILLSSCSKNIVVDADPHSKDSEVLLTLSTGDISKTYNIPSKKPVRIPVGAYINEGSAINVYADALHGFPSKTVIPIISSPVKIAESMALSSDKPCMNVRITYDKNAEKVLGPLHNPIVVVDSVSIDGKRIMGKEQIEKVQSALQILEKVINSKLRTITICVKPGIISGPEDRKIDIQYHIEAKGSKINCRVKSNEGALKISLRGTGECLRGGWSKKGAIRIRGKEPVEETIVLQNICKRTSVSGKISVKADTNTMISTNGSSFSLAPGAKKGVTITIRSKGDAPRVAVIQPFAEYTPNGSRKGTHELQIPPKIAIIGDLSTCFKADNVSYDPYAGAVVRIRGNTNIFLCNALKIEKAYIGMGDEKAELKCDGIWGRYTCSTTNIPADTAIAMFSREINKKENNAEIYLQIGGEIGLTSTLRKFKITAEHIEPLDASISKVPLTRMVFLDEHTCKVRNDTPFEGNVAVASKRGGKLVFIPTKQELLPPTDGLQIDACAGDVKVTALAKIKNAYFDLGSCTKKIEVPTPLPVAAPAVRNVTNQLLSYVPENATPAYEFNQDSGQISYYQPPFGEYACRMAPCDSKRALIAAMRWIVENAQRKITENLESTYLFATETNGSAEVGDLELNAGKIKVRVDVNADQPIDTKTIVAQNVKQNERYYLASIRVSEADANYSAKVVVPESFWRIPYIRKDGSRCTAISFMLETGKIYVVKKKNDKVQSETIEIPVLNVECNDQIPDPVKNTAEIFADNVLFEGLAKSVVNISADATVPKTLPITGIITPGEGRSMSAIPVKPSTGNQGKIYVIGLGAIPASNVKTCKDGATSIPVWIYQPVPGNTIYNNDANILAIKMSDGAIGIVSEAVWRSIKGAK